MTVSEVIQSIPLSKTCSKLESISDIFNDKIEYKCRTFNDLIRLHTSLLPVAEKFELFGESPKAAIELKKFLTNFEILQVGFGFVEEKIQDKTNKSSEIEKDLENLNEAIKALFKKYPITTSPANFNTERKKPAYNEYEKAVPKTWGNEESPRKKKPLERRQ